MKEVVQVMNGMITRMMRADFLCCVGRSPFALGDLDLGRAVSRWCGRGLAADHRLGLWTTLQPPAVCFRERLSPDCKAGRLSVIKCTSRSKCFSALTAFLVGHWPRHAIGMR